MERLKPLSINYDITGMDSLFSYETFERYEKIVDTNAHPKTRELIDHLKKQKN